MTLVRASENTTNDDGYGHNHNPLYPAPQDHWMIRTLAHYELQDQIGQGTYGSVYKATCKDTGRMVAMKKMKIHHGGYWGMPLQLIREIKLLRRLRHPNLVRMVEVVTSKGVEYLDPNDDDDPKPTTLSEGEKHSKSGAGRDSTADIRESYKGNLFLVLEYVEHDLTGLLDVNFPFSAAQIQSIFRQLLSALEYLHSQKYVHRDIKSSNILLDSSLRVHLADFGLARSLEAPLVDQVSSTSSSSLHSTSSSLLLTNKVITLWYRPPEILLGAVHYNTSVDIWSAGCILAELLLGKALLPGKTDLEQLMLTIDLLGPPPRETWDYIRNNLLLKSTTLTSKSGSSSSGPSAAVAALDYDKVVEQHRLRQEDETVRVGTSMRKLRTKYVDKVPGPALNLLERMLEWDPRKRITAAHALEHRYFRKPSSSSAAAEEASSQAPLAPLLGGDFHEFQTKKKRKQAKVLAEEQKQAALLRGASRHEAEEEMDQEYRRLMKQVAEHGLNSFDNTGDAANRDAAKEQGDDVRVPDGNEEEKRRDEQRRGSRDEYDSHSRHRRDRRRRRDHDGDVGDDRRKRRRSDSDRRDESGDGRGRGGGRDRERPLDFQGDSYGRGPPMEDRPYDRRPPEFEADLGRGGGVDQDHPRGRPRGGDGDSYRRGPRMGDRPYDRRPPEFEGDSRRGGTDRDHPRHGGRPRGGDEGDHRRRERPQAQDRQDRGRPQEPYGYDRGRIMDERPGDATRPRGSDHDRRHQQSAKGDEGRPRESNAMLPEDEAMEERDRDTSRRGKESPRSSDDRRSGHRRRKKSKERRRRKDRERQHARDDHRDSERGSRQGGERSHDRAHGRKGMNRGDRDSERFNDDRMPHEARGPGPPRGAGGGPPPPRAAYGHYGPAKDKGGEPHPHDREPRSRDRRR